VASVFVTRMTCDIIVNHTCIINELVTLSYVTFQLVTVFIIHTGCHFDCYLVTGTDFLLVNQCLLLFQILL